MYVFGGNLLMTAGGAAGMKGDARIIVHSCGEITNMSFMISVCQA